MTQRHILAALAPSPDSVLTNATDETAPADGQATPSKPAETNRPRGNPCRGQVVGLTDHRPRALMPDIQITVSPAVMGSSHPGRTGPRPLCHRPTPSSARQPASGRHGRGSGHRGFASMAAGRYELASQSHRLGFRGVLGRENTSLTEELTAELAGILSWVVGRVGPADLSGEVH